MEIRAVVRADEEQWKALYRGYREFYRLTPDEAVVERVWSWIFDETIELECLVAVEGDELLGLANNRPFLRPSSGTIGTYLDDLFVRPDRRRTGAGRALLDALAAKDGRSVVRWITADDNHVARTLYDSVAEATHWVTYDLRP